MASDDPIPKRCSFCKRAGHVYSECEMAKKHRAGKKRTPFMLKTPKPAASVNGAEKIIVAMQERITEWRANIEALEAALKVLGR